MTEHRIQGFNVAFAPSGREFDNAWTPYAPNERTLLPRGWAREGRLPLREAIVWDKDVPVKMRDGITIRADIFRPASRENERLPALVPWSPYGKTGTGFYHVKDLPHVGVPASRTSGLEKFEGPDPAEWCPRGYAIVHADARGIWNSEGDMFFFGKQEGRDGHDLIEWVAAQNWSNESVATVGNSWLGIAQWFIAAEKPPHLKAIAPWEGVTDFYRQTLCRGGIPYPAFFKGLSGTLKGNNNYEDVVAMIAKHPHMNAYWEDKNPKVTDIEVPMYVTMSYSTGLHTEGSFRGWKYAASKEKWLRIHPTQEWHDLYLPDNNDDLQRFLDHYLLEKDNGWELTPKVRASLLRFGDRPPITHRVEDNYPPSRTVYTTFYLDAETGNMSPEVQTQSAKVSHSTTPWDVKGSHFTHAFSKYTEVLGPSKVRLFMSADSKDDLDVYIILRKLDADGNELIHLNVPIESQPPGSTVETIPNLNVYKHIGPTGRIRASKRALGQDPMLSQTQLEQQVPSELWLPYDQEQKVPRGSVVELDIPIWPTGMVFEAGEKLCLQVNGHDQEFHEWGENVNASLENLNEGSHTVYTGEKYPSQIMLPLVF